MREARHDYSEFRGVNVSPEPTGGVDLDVFPVKTFCGP